MTEPRWAVISTRPAQEERAEAKLREAGYRVYLPRQSKILRGVRIVDGRRVRCRGAGSTILVPLISCFLFAELHPGQWIEPDRIGHRWEHWRHNRQRAFVSSDAIEILREEERKRMSFDDRPNAAPFTDGQEIEREISPGYRVSAVFKRLKSADVAIISAMMFNRQMDHPAPLAALYPVSA